MVKLPLVVIHRIDGYSFRTWSSLPSKDFINVEVNVISWAKRFRHLLLKLSGLDFRVREVGVGSTIYLKLIRKPATQVIRQKNCFGSTSAWSTSGAIQINTLQLFLPLILTNSVHSLNPNAFQLQITFLCRNIKKSLNANAKH